MNPKTACKVGACGTVVAGACCLGLAGVLLGFFGATTALAYVNKYGDLFFIPSFIVFGTLLVYSLLKIRKNWLTYAVSAAVIIFGLYVTVTAFVGGHSSHAGMNDAVDSMHAATILLASKLFDGRKGSSR